MAFPVGSNNVMGLSSEACEPLVPGFGKKVSVPWLQAVLMSFSKMELGHRLGPMPSWLVVEKVQIAFHQLKKASDTLLAVEVHLRLGTVVQTIVEVHLLLRWVQGVHLFVIVVEFF